MNSAHAQFFWANHAADNWLARYMVNRPPDSWILEAIRDIGNVESVLDVGCNSGRLADRLVQAGIPQVCGFDINAEAVEAAQKKGLDVAVGMLPDALKRLPQFDVIVSSYCLAYIGPEQITTTLAAMLTWAKRAVILAEPSAGPGVDEDEYVNGQYVEWRHEYLDRIEDAVKLLSVKPSYVAKRQRRSDDGGVNALIVVEISHGHS